MSEKSNTDTAARLLAGAYALKTSKDNIDYYRDFAEIYDAEFADGMGYVYPEALAVVYRTFAFADDVPILDVGCGTGLVGALLGVPAEKIDGVDISKDMLEAARQKSIYGALYQVDLLSGTGELPGTYGAIVSAGTFTFGHLGADVLPQLLQLGRESALYCIGVNSDHFEQQGFSAVLESMVAARSISEPVFETRKIYAAASSEHAEDTSTIVIYRKLTA